MYIVCSLHLMLNINCLYIYRQYILFRHTCDWKLIINWLFCWKSLLFYFLVQWWCKSVIILATQESSSLIIRDSIVSGDYIIFYLDRNLSTCLHGYDELLSITFVYQYLIWTKKIQNIFVITYVILWWICSFYWFILAYVSVFA